jgi:hypothetical protein
VNNNLVEGRPAGAVDLGGSAQAASAGYPVGAIHFGPAWEDDSVQLTHKGWSQITDGMAKSIVRLECEAEELRAEVAMLREERNILGTASLSKAPRGTTVTKAAVTEGGTGNSKVERPEPSPHLSDTPETDAHSPAGYAIIRPDGVRTDYVPADFARKLERERDEARTQYRTTELLGMELVKTIDQLKAEKAAIFSQLVSLQAGSRRATPDEIAESVREKYDERHEGEGMDND